MKNIEQLAKLAASEKPKVREQLKQYTPIILELRKKGWSFREIAAWLNKHADLDVDHNDVYRAYDTQANSPTI